jgi:hypothetical protein
MVIAPSGLGRLTGTRGQRRRRSERIRALIAALKRDAGGCRDCGAHADTPSALTFDHLPAHPKRFVLADADRYSMAAVQAEAAKCELVCVPCHRLRERARGR